MDIEVIPHTASEVVINGQTSSVGCSDMLDAIVDEVFEKYRDFVEEDGPNIAMMLREEDIYVFSREVVARAMAASNK